MAILQAIFALIGRSAGKVLNTIFGWAVRALFGATSGKQQTVLSLLVMAAALWPLLLIGTFAPRVAAFALAFIPIPESVPDWPIQLGWIALALVVPAIVGVALAAKAPADAPRESFIVRVLRGYPTTLGIALAFLISFISVPIQRLIAAVRGKQDVLVPLVTDQNGYELVSKRLKDVLNQNGFKLEEAEPGFWMKAPGQVLRKLAGASMRNYVPDRTVYMRGPALEVALYPNSCLLRGPATSTVIAQGLTLEALTPCPAFQTTDVSAQKIERQIKRVWGVLAENPVAHVESRVLQSRLKEISQELLTLKVPYEEWETLYRQILQLERALHGEPQLLANKVDTKLVEKDGSRMENSAEHETSRPHHVAANHEARQMSTLDLMGEIASKTALLVRKEVDLARTEIQADLSAELAAAKKLAVAFICGIAALNMLLVAAVFALAPYLGEGWSALAIAGALLAIALISGISGWKSHVEKPLARTRRTLKEDIQWAKEELA